MKMKKIEPLEKIEVESLFPYDFLTQVYFPLFRIDLGVTIPEAEKVFKNIAAYWDERDREIADEHKCKISFDEQVFSHITCSDRKIVYDIKRHHLVVESPTPSSGFLYQILSLLTPLLEPEKWRGIGGGNIDATGETIEEFKIFVSGGKK